MYKELFAPWQRLLPTQKNKKTKVILSPEKTASAPKQKQKSLKDSVPYRQDKSTIVALRASGALIDTGDSPPRWSTIQPGPFRLDRSSVHWKTASRSEWPVPCKHSVLDLSILAHAPIQFCRNRADSWGPALFSSGSGLVVAEKYPILKDIECSLLRT